MKQNTEIKEVDINKIIVNINVRIEETDKTKDVSGLMTSIKQHGQEQNIGIEPARNYPGKRSDNNGYILLYGSRRLDAMKKLGWKTIVCKIYGLVTPLGEAQRILLNVTENVQRKDTTMAETGRQISRLMNECKYTIQETAIALGKSIDYIKTCRDEFNRIPADYRASVAQTSHKSSVPGTIPLTIARKALRIQKHHNLPKEANEDLWSSIQRDKIPSGYVEIIGRLVRSGLTVAEALKAKDKYIPYHLYVTVEKNEIEALASKHGMSHCQYMVNCIYGEVPPLKRPAWVTQIKLRRSQRGFTKDGNNGLKEAKASG